ncbi:MAG: tetratricopeptide repeat protein, partial [Cyanobacteria bacterium J06627_8]
PDDDEAWYNRGIALAALGRTEEAIASYDQAIEIKSDFAGAYFNKACAFARWGKANDAIKALQQAIELDSKYRKMAKTDSDFDSIRDDERFQQMLQDI